jgi:hypothetical protein
LSIVQTSLTPEIPIGIVTVFPTLPKFQKSEVGFAESAIIEKVVPPPVIVAPDGSEKALPLVEGAPPELLTAYPVNGEFAKLG